MKTQEDVVTHEIEVFTVVVILAYVKLCQIISCIDTVLSRLQPEVESSSPSPNVSDSLTVDMTSHP